MGCMDDRAGTGLGSALGCIWGGREHTTATIWPAYYQATRSERYGALVGQSEDWITLPVRTHGTSCMARTALIGVSLAC